MDDSPRIPADMQTVPLALAARLTAISAPWLRELHRRGEVHLVRPGGPRGKFYMPVRELQRLTGSGPFAI